MSPSRRLWLFLPLIALTLFFAALGWRNWHLTSDKDGVLLAASDYAFSHLSAYPIVYIPYDRKKELSPLAQKRLLQRHPKAHFERDFQKAIEKGGYLEFSDFESQSVFRARCRVMYGALSEQESIPLTLTRNPLAFWDNQWHVAQSPR